MENRGGNDRPETRETAGPLRQPASRLPPPPGPPPTLPLPPLPAHAGPTESSPLHPWERRAIFRWLDEIAFPEDW